MKSIRFALVALALTACAPAFAESSHQVSITTVGQSGGANIGVAPSSAATATTATPSKLSREDMLDLENAGFKFDEMDREIARIRDAATKLREHRDEVLKRYSVKIEDVGKSVTIMADGTIKRADPATPAPPPKPTQAKLAKKK